jgi:mannosylglycoprotein endo-beta-mannosidase
MNLRVLALLIASFSALSSAQQPAQTITGWQLQDVAKVTTPAAIISTTAFHPQRWYAATVPGTVLTTLVNNKVYPEPLYGENMREIPESLNQTSYWYRATMRIPAANIGRHTWLHFAGINYFAEIWVNGHQAGTLRGAFLRGDFDITAFVKPGTLATLAVLIAPQPHPGTPHEHTIANGVGKNGGITAIDGPTFLSTIGWDWLAAVRDRDTGIWLPVTLSSTGPVILKNPYVTSELSPAYDSANLTVAATLENTSATPLTGTLVGLITTAKETRPITFRKEVTVGPNASTPVLLDAHDISALHLDRPQLWWPNGYGPQNLYKLTLRFELAGRASDVDTGQFGIRKIEYQVPDSENLTLSVNGVRIMVRGGDWGLDEALKRIPRQRLDAQFHMHALAHMNMIRNWVGQSTSPDFYDLADRYGILLWDEFFQPNPSDGPNPTDIPTYLANVTDKVERYRNHPSIAVWCARNEGYPPKSLDDTLRTLMATLDPSRLYQSNSADGRGVSSHGPYYWRAPRFFYELKESFKTETGSVSIPTLESIQGMMPEKDWETINDDWAQHDMARGAQRGDKYPSILAQRYGPIRNLADFVRKGQLANYEAFRAMYEGRNAQMFTATTGVLTWMSHPAQPSFVWQLYHYDLEPNASLFAVEKAAEPIHIQLNESTGIIQIVNNKAEALTNLTVQLTLFGLDSKIVLQKPFDVAEVPSSSTFNVAPLELPEGISPVYFVKLDLAPTRGLLLSTNFYWHNNKLDDFTGLSALPTAELEAIASTRLEGANTLLTLTLRNLTPTIALMTHVQLHQKQSGRRVLPVFYSDNYITLVPGESRTITIQCATKDLNREAPLLLLDGFNVDVHRIEGAVSIAPNVNALPTHWPASSLVP